MKQSSFSIPQVILISFFFFIALPGVAQTNIDFTYYKEKYPTDNLVWLNREMVIDIKLENENILITKTTLDKNLFLNETATQYSKESVSYSNFFQLEKIEASSYSLKKGKYYESKVTEFKTKDELNGSFHDDVKSLNFIYPNLSPGSKTKLFVVEKVNNPRFLSNFYFGGFYPILNAKLTVLADKGVELSFKEFNTDSINLTFNKTEKRNKIIYSWESKNINAIEMEDGTPNYKNYYPHIIPVITQYKTKKNKIIKLSSEVPNLYNWYYSLVKNINQSPIDTGLIQLVNELIKNKDTELEKVRAIYYWVQNNIKYIAFEYALGGFIPREANIVYKKKYGDCKDNSSILYEMLKIAGIKGCLTWVGTRSIPYKYNELPTPAVDNHMILTYKDGINTYFLDATGRYIPLELPTSFIQGKEALVGKDQDYEIIEIPVINAEQNTEVDSSFVRIDKKSLKGRGSRLYTGYNKIDVFNELEPLNNGKKTEERYNQLLRKGNNKFIIENVKEVNKFDYDKNFQVNYDYTVSDYVVTTTDEVYVNLNLDKILLAKKIEENRETDIEIEYKFFYSFINELSIPEGYTVDYLPGNLNFSNDLLSVAITYEQKGNKIIYSHQVKFDFLILIKAKHEAYMDLVKKVEKAYKESIVFKKIKT
ncbi:MAG: DUF3857 domain-containing protein [Bacteroidota bacterium]